MHIWSVISREKAYESLQLSAFTTYYIDSVIKMNI